MAPRPARSLAAQDSADAGTASPGPAPSLRFPPSLAAAVERCWRKAAAPAEWNLSGGQFQAALERSVAQRFPGASPNQKAIEAYLESLYSGDLALACACAAGSPAAWEFFVAQFRPELYRAARAIAGDANARELADSLYADLYGLRESEGSRKSLFDYFHGRSKLTTWLRAVLAQRHVDEVRCARRTEPLEDDAGEERAEIAARTATGVPADPERANYLAILQATLAAALAGLDSRDRLRLAYYYADDRTLAEIGRLLGEHEATVSRKLDRARTTIRRRVEAALREGRKWNEEQVRQCCEYARGEWPFDLTSHLHPVDSGPAKQAGAKWSAGARKI
ncbi:MAG TPA: sigma-70 family RNA polymerase sigma factor [Candidatus Acidoferrales bacterium]|nr:sigma-70 family RNA polymerase sigma factor [Candidatus Acidoferrales bacterium]